MSTLRVVGAVDRAGLTLDGPFDEALVGATDNLAEPAGLLVADEVGERLKTGAFEDLAIAVEYSVRVTRCSALALESIFDHMAGQSDVR